jgi:hypothetical protein
VKQKSSRWHRRQALKLVQTARMYQRLWKSEKTNAKKRAGWWRKYRQACAKVLYHRAKARHHAREGRDLPESIGQHGYPQPPHQETHAQRLRRIAAARRRYRQTTQSQGEQGSAYDQRRRRTRRRRRGR